MWDRRRDSGPLEPKLAPRDLFAELLEHAPVMGILLDHENRVVGANEAARDFFEIEQSRLPASLVEAPLVHHRATVLTQLVAGRREGEKLLFLTDITELRRLSTVRQEFVANLVHELKTPITSLRLTAESLLGDPLPKDRRRFAERLVREADLMSKIIDNLRQLGDIEVGAMNVDVSRFDLAELVDDSVARLGIDRPISTSIPPGLVIATDRPKLVQALDNLLDNAAKFSPPGTAIDVQAEV